MQERGWFLSEVASLQSSWVDSTRRRGRARATRRQPHSLCCHHRGREGAGAHANSDPWCLCEGKEGKPRLPGSVSVWPGQLHAQGCQCHNKVCAVWLLRKGFQSRDERGSRAGRQAPVKRPLKPPHAKPAPLEGVSQKALLATSGAWKLSTDPVRRRVLTRSGYGSKHPSGK